MSWISAIAKVGAKIAGSSSGKLVKKVASHAPTLFFVGSTIKGDSDAKRMQSEQRIANTVAYMEPNTQEAVRKVIKEK